MEITEIVGIAEIVGIVSSNPQTRRRRDHPMALLTQKTGARSIEPLDMIWMSAKLVWIIRRCHHQHQWRKNHVEANIVEPIPTMRIRWVRST
jgi:hypothetical protein